MLTDHEGETCVRGPIRRPVPISPDSAGRDARHRDRERRYGRDRSPQGPNGKRTCTKYSVLRYGRVEIYRSARKHGIGNDAIDYALEYAMVVADLEPDADPPGNRSGPSRQPPGDHLARTGGGRGPRYPRHASSPRVPQPASNRRGRLMTKAQPAPHGQEERLPTPRSKPSPKRSPPSTTTSRC